MGATAVALLAVGLLSISPPAEAIRNARIGFLSPSWQDRRGTVHLEFQRALGAAGYVIGKNLSIVSRFSEGHDERLDTLAAEIIREQPDVIVALQPSGALAAKRATSTIPIVFISISDPVRLGLVQSLRRPGGNITGVANTPADLNRKRLEILKDALPNLQRVAIVARAGNRNSQLHLKDSLDSAQALGMEGRVYNVETVDQLGRTFDTASRDGMQAVLLVQDGVFFFARRTIAELALRHRLPMIADGRVYAHDGVFLSYGISDYGMLAGAAASAVDMILHGVPVGDIPVDQPLDVGLAVNLRVARALDIPVKPSLILRASEIIEQ